jgi:hypothetical protein
MGPESSMYWEPMKARNSFRSHKMKGGWFHQKQWK